MLEKFCHKKKITLHDVAQELNVKKCTIKNWEKLLYPDTSLQTGAATQGKKVYSLQDVQLFADFKELMSKQRLSVDEAKKMLFNKFENASLVENSFKSNLDQESNIPEKNTTQLARATSIVVSINKDSLVCSTESTEKTSISTEGFYDPENTPEQIKRLLSDLRQKTLELKDLLAKKN